MNFKLSKILLLIIFTITINCLGQNKKTNPSITIVNCDSIYTNKRISVKLINFDDEKDGYDDEKNSIFEIQQSVSGKNKILLKDSIFSKTQEIEFVDFNNDKIKDILVQNISDVRSNWTYSLYLYNSKENIFKKVIGFEEIKNPLLNSKYNIVESHVNSGSNWIGFYKIVKYKVYDYKIEIIDKQDKKSETEYKKAINKIIKRKI